VGRGDGFGSGDPRLFQREGGGGLGIVAFHHHSIGRVYFFLLGGWR